MITVLKEIVFTGKRESRKEKAQNKSSCEIKPKVEKNFDLTTEGKVTLKTFYGFDDFTSLYANEFQSYPFISLPEHLSVQQLNSEKPFVLESPLPCSSPKSANSLPSNLDITNFLDK